MEGRTVATETANAKTLVAAAFAQLQRELRPDHEPMLLLDVRLEQLTSSGPGSAAERIKELTTRAPVILTDEKALHPIVEYLRRYTSAPIRLVTSTAVFARLLSGSYDTLPGALLESLGKLLVEDVRLYVHPISLDTFLATTGGRVGAASSISTVSLDDLRCEPPLEHLLRYLRGAKWIVPLELS